MAVGWVRKLLRGARREDGVRKVGNRGRRGTENIMNSCMVSALDLTSFYVTYGEGTPYQLTVQELVRDQSSEVL